MGLKVETVARCEECKGSRSDTGIVFPAIYQEYLTVSLNLLMSSPRTCGCPDVRYQHQSCPHFDYEAWAKSTNLAGAHEPEEYDEYARSEIVLCSGVCAAKWILKNPVLGQMQPWDGSNAHKGQMEAAAELTKKEVLGD